MGTLVGVVRRAEETFGPMLGQLEQVQQMLPPLSNFGPDGVALWPGMVRLQGDDFDYEAEVDVVDGRAEVVALTITRHEAGPSLSARALRGASLGHVLRSAVRARMVKLDENGAGWSRGNRKDGAVTDGDVRSLRVAPGPGRPKVDAGEVARAADLYRQAVEKGEPRTAAVARELSVSAGTARKRVMAARKAGLLPSTSSTRPGVGEVLSAEQR